MIFPNVVMLSKIAFYGILAGTAIVGFIVGMVIGKKKKEND